jgi:putative transposase
MSRKGDATMKRTQGVVRAKPHRLHREDYRGEIAVAFTICVARRVRLFVNPNVVHSVADLLNRTAPLPVFSIPIYCFMPDHLHVVLLGQEEQCDAWEAMVRFKQNSGYWMQVNHPGTRWQKGFYDHIIRLRDELATQIRYIAENPVLGGLIGKWEDYPYTGSVGFELRTVIEEAGRR